MNGSQSMPSSFTMKFRYSTEHWLNTAQRNLVPLWVRGRNFNIFGLTAKTWRLLWRSLRLSTSSYWWRGCRASSTTKVYSLAKSVQYFLLRCRFPQKFFGDDKDNFQASIPNLRAHIPFAFPDDFGAGFGVPPEYLLQAFYFLYRWVRACGGEGIGAAFGVDTAVQVEEGELMIVHHCILW